MDQLSWQMLFKFVNLNFVNFNTNPNPSLRPVPYIDLKFNKKFELMLTKRVKAYSSFDLVV